MADSPTTQAAPAAPAPTPSSAGSPLLSPGSATRLGLDTLLDPPETGAEVVQPAASVDPGAKPGESAAGGSEPSPTKPAGEKPNGGASAKAAEQTPTAGADDADTVYLKSLVEPPAAEGKQGEEQIKSDTAAKPEEIEANFLKAINPDGKADAAAQIENAKKLYADSQAMIGRQSAEVHEVRKLNETMAAGIQELSESFLEEVDGKFQFSVVKAAKTLGAEDAVKALQHPEVADMLAGAGFELVPLAAVEHGGEADIEEAIAKQLVNDASLNHDERMEAIEGDPRLRREFRRLERAETLKRAEMAAQRRLSAEQKTAADRAAGEQRQAALASAVDNLKKSVPHYAEIAPDMKRYNALLTNATPEQWLGAVRKMAEYDRLVTKLLPSMKAAAFEAGRQKGLSESGLVLPYGGGSPRVSGGGGLALSAESSARLGLS